MVLPGTVVNGAAEVDVVEAGADVVVLEEEVVELSLLVDVVDEEVVVAAGVVEVVEEDEVVEDEVVLGEEVVVVLEVDVVVADCASAGPAGAITARRATRVASTAALAAGRARRSLGLGCIKLSSSVSAAYWFDLGGSPAGSAGGRGRGRSLPAWGAAYSSNPVQPINVM